MPIFKQDPITGADLSEYLAQDDFQFEMDILQICKEYGYSCHGGTYTDPLLNKDRQYDILFQVSNGCRVVQAAIECKHLKDWYPLLVSRTVRQEQESFHELVISHCEFGHVSETDPLDSPARKPLILRLAGSDTFYRRTDFVGKSMKRVGRDKANKDALYARDDEVFDKWLQAVHSMHEIVNTSEYDFRVCGVKATATYVIPILVIPDGTLWVADYGTNGALLGEPMKVEHCLFYIDRRVPSKWGTYAANDLYIYTKSGLLAFLKSLNSHSPESVWSKYFTQSNRRAPL